MKKFLKIVMAIVVAGGILALGGCVFSVFLAGKAVESVDKSIKTSEQKTKDINAQLTAEISKTKPVIKKEEYGGYKAEYTLKNPTKEKLEYIEINYAVFDANHTKIDDSFTNITDIEAGQTFKVTLDIYEDGATTHEITSISTTPFED